jgi:hypothetical protein
MMGVVLVVKFLFVLNREERRSSAVRPQSLQLSEEDGLQRLVTVGPPGNTPGTSAFPSPPNSPG